MEGLPPVASPPTDAHPYTADTRHDAGSRQRRTGGWETRHQPPSHSVSAARDRSNGAWVSMVENTIGISARTAQIASWRSAATR